MKHARRSGLCWLLATVAALPPAPPAFAHGGEDHAHAPPAASAPPVAGPVGDAPRRLADGGLFVPKAAQHRLGLRTVKVTPADLAVGLEFNGRVVADPAAAGRVQAAQAGRLEAVGPWPTLGRRVARGQVLARLRPTVGGLERGGQQALLAELDAQIALTEARLARYAQLEGAIPGKEVEAARIDLAALGRRRAAIAGGLAAVEALRAPVAGVISAAHAVPGQVVEARETLFEIVDPQRLMVEALAYDPAQAADLAGASLVLPGGGLPLDFVGAGQQMRDQALPLLFRVRSGAERLAVGLPARVAARTSATLRGMALPRSALERAADGGERVWVKRAPERFVPRRVETRPLDGERVAVVAGLAEGDRVVVAGASLLAQVR